MKLCLSIIVCILLVTSDYTSLYSGTCNNIMDISARDTIVNPNLKVYRNVSVYEFFSSLSFSGVDLYQGFNLNNEDAMRDVELADSAGFGRDRFYLRSGDGTQDNMPIGQETRFVPQFNTRGINYSQAQFDTLIRIDVGHADPIIPAIDFQRWSTFSLGRSFVSSDIRVYGFWLKGKKIAFGLTYEVYGLLYIKSIEIVNLNGIQTYKLTVDIKINTHGDNDFRPTIVGVNPVSSEVLSDYSLYQNYPNPFNPSTKIKFDLPKNALTKITVYDSRGKEIETIVNEELKQGIYEVNWDASQFPSGVYFYKFETNEFTQTRKMLLIK